MFEVALGQGEDIDSGSAVQTAIAQCRRNLSNHQPRAGIVFSSVDFNHSLILSEVLRAFPDIELIGCTTGGEFSSGFGFSDDSVTLVLFCTDTVSIRAGVARRTSEDPQSAAAAAIRQARRELGSPAGLCLVFPDGIVGSANALVAAMDKLLQPGCPVFGGVPSREWETDAPTLQFFRDEVLEDAAPFLLFENNIRYAFSISNSWKPIGQRSKVTRSSGYEVLQIGAKRALDFYREYLGTHRLPAIEFPLAVYPDLQQSFFVRSPSDYDEQRGSVFFSGPIPAGTSVQLTEVTRKRILDDTRRSAEALLGDRAIGWHPSVAMAFSCATRKQILGTQTPEELKTLQRQLPATLPLCGFYTFGELAPLALDQPSLLHNCTLVTLVLGADGPASEKPDPGQRFSEHSTALSPTAETNAGLQREVRFLQKKLQRSERYRQRLERNKDLNDALFRKINREMRRAHLEIKRKNDLLRKSLALANEIQLNLLPKAEPHHRHLDVAGRIIYCSATGGDYYDFLFSNDPNRLDVVIGDVTGHGVEAALLMTTARALLRSRFPDTDALAETITAINRHLVADLGDSGRFISLFYLAIDPLARRLNWVRAGHDPALFYRPAEDRFEELRGEGLALGVDAQWQYREYETDGFNPGEMLFLGTDGIWETHSPRGEMFGKQRLLEILRRNATEPAGRIVERVVGALNRFRGDREPEDDVTMVAVKWKDPPAPEGVSSK
ncbi:MAG TPA: SpoIIE family protein phosphatase [Desulfobacterales bacterium]